MKIQKTITFVTIALSLFLISSSCNKEDKDYPRIDNDLKEWLAPFNEVDQEFTYKNSSDNVATIRVKHRFFADTEILNCLRYDGSYECDFEYATLEFTSDTAMYLTAWLLAEDKLTLNYSSQGTLSPEKVRHEEYEEVFEVPQPDNFNVVYSPNYDYQDVTNNAMIVKTTTLDNLFGALPPDSFIFVKGMGIVEWTDYSGETWKLNN